MKRIVLVIAIATVTAHFGQLAVAKFSADMSTKVSRLDRIGGER